MLRFLLITVSMLLGLKSYAELSFKPYGTLSVDAIRNSAGTITPATGNSVYSVSSVNESNHTMHIHNSKVGLTGESDLSQFNVSGKIDVDFNGESSSVASELVAQPRIIEFYMMLNHKGSDVNFLVGQSNDIVAPLNPTMYDENNLSAQGNLGWYRPQARLSREFFNHLELALSAALPSSGRETTANRYDYAGHIGFDTKDVLDAADLKVKLGAGYIDGKDKNTHSVHGQEVATSLHLLAYDMSVSWNEMLFISGEMYDGNGAGHYNGIGTFNTATNALPSSDGWWAQVMLKHSKFSLGAGMGETKADDKAQKIGSTTSTAVPSVQLKGSRTWTNLTYDFNSQVSTGIEYAMVSSNWATNKNVDKDTERYNLNLSYKF